MSRLMDGHFARHSVVDSDGWGEASADPDDYWDKPDTFVFEGGTLVRMNHPYVTVTGLVVLSPRPLKGSPTIGDLRRVRRAKSSLRAQVMLLDTSVTMEGTEG
jgi:hypothetical protein